MKTLGWSEVRDRERLVAWLRLSRVHQRAERVLAEQVRRHGLTMAQFDVLAQIGVDEGGTQQELADRLLVTKGNVAQLLDRMEAMGLVERRPSGTGRANALFLTEVGRRRRDQVLREHEAMAVSVFDALDDESVASLSAALRVVDHDLRGRSCG